MSGGQVDSVHATLLPHSDGRGPSLRTGRGVRVAGPVDDVVATYGTPPDPDAKLIVRRRGTPRR